MSIETFRNAIREQVQDFGGKCTHEQAKELTDKFFALIKSEVENDGKLIVRDFGTFSMVTKKACVARNPQSGEPIKVPAKTVLKFKSKVEY